MKIYIKRHLGYLRHFEESPQTKSDGIYIKRLTIGKICYTISKDIGGFVKVESRFLLSTYKI
jgi:hypothetical protein